MAQSTTDIYGQVVGAAEVFNSTAGTNAEATFTNSHLLRVAAGLPAKALLVSQGRSWSGRNTTGVAAVTANPAITASHFTLYNGEASGSGIVYVIDRIIVDKYVTDATQANPFKLLAEVSGAGVETAPTDATNAKGSLSGKGTYNGKARIALSQTVVGSAWMALGTTPSHGIGGTYASNANTTMEVILDGLLIIPATGELNLACVEATAAAAAQMFYTVIWHEVTMPVNG